MTVTAHLRKLPFLCREAAMDDREKFLGLHLLTWAGPRRCDLPLHVVADHVTAVVASGSLLVATRLGQLVPGHGGQEPQELFGCVQGILATASTNKKTAHHRLTDIHGV